MSVLTIASTVITDTHACTTVMGIAHIHGLNCFYYACLYRALRSTMLAVVYGRRSRQYWEYC
ncbi:MAG: hypothetical protein V3U71_10345 [Cocleimonas sp.]